MLASQEPAGAPHAAREAAQSEATGRGKRIARRVTRQCFIRGWTKFRGRLLTEEQLAQYFGGRAVGAVAAKIATEEARQQLEEDEQGASPASVATQLFPAPSCGRLKKVQCNYRWRQLPENSCRGRAGSWRVQRRHVRSFMEDDWEFTEAYVDEVPENAAQQWEALEALAAKVPKRRRHLSHIDVDGQVRVRELRKCAYE